MRTQDEIAARLNEKADEFLNFEPQVLVGCLAFDAAAPFLKEGATREEWDRQRAPFTEERIKADMRDYMGFAIGKAEDHRGISASRSVQKMVAWMWLLEDDEGVAFAEDSRNYQNYGAPILRFVCKRYGFPWPDSEDMNRMADSLPCVDGCDMGCAP